MVYSGIQMFMNKLNHLILNFNDIPSINHPQIISARPQLQLLYDELHNPIIQTLFIHQHQQLEKVNDLKKIFIDAAEKAQYIVDRFLSIVHIRNNKLFTTSHHFNCSLNLDDVLRSFESIKVELTSIRIDNMKMDSSPITETKPTQSASFTRNSKKLMDEIVDETDYIGYPFLSARDTDYIGYPFLSAGDNELFTTSEYFTRLLNIDDVRHLPTSGDLNPSLDLDGVMRSFESDKVELARIRINMASSSFTRNSKGSKKLMDEIVDESEYIGYPYFLSARDNELFSTSDYFTRSLNIDNMKTGSSPRPERKPSQSASFTRISKGSNKLMDEIVVGLDANLQLIRDKLVEDKKKLHVVSIVGMGGIGKTTLATKVFNDPFVMYHFHVRVWVTVSQTYDKHNVLIQILESIHGQLQLQKDISECELREMVHKNLMGKRYLIVIDDIWYTETWDNVKVFFPHDDNNGSRILLTSRLTEVAKHANPDGLIHQLDYLSKEQSWDLLCGKVFNGNECPEWSIKPGMQIVENCHGLPLAVLVIAGVLAKKGPSERFWVEIAKMTGSYIVGDRNGCMETLALSYNHLPLHLRECFLYLGGFPEDYKFKVERLIRLWMAEGFIQDDGNQSLEDIAEGYLTDLIDRNLVIIADRHECNGPVTACKLHDIVRELCLKKANEEQFILQTILSSPSSNAITPPYKPVRVFLQRDIRHRHFDHTHSKKLRSLLVFSPFGLFGDDIAKRLHSFVLLRVLDLESVYFSDFPKGLELLVHLRYLAIQTSLTDFPSSILNLWNLQTLIFMSRQSRVVLPSNISDLVNLRHFHCSFIEIRPSIEKSMNLQTISGTVDLTDGLDKFQKGFPYIKKLECEVYGDKEYDFKSLTCLEELNVHGGFIRFSCIPKLCGKDRIKFPATLKTLKLSLFRLQWSDMSIIQSLPNLQVLILTHMAVEGSCWNTDEQEFPQLKCLTLSSLDIKHWEVDSKSFPCLRKLEISSCLELEEIPLEIGDIPTLELIKIKWYRPSLGDSVRRIQEEQNDLGNYDLKIDISDKLLED